MRIAKVSGFIYRQPILHRAPVLEKTSVVRPWHETVLVRVETDTGLVGWGEAFGHFGIARATLEAFEVMVVPRCIGVELNAASMPNFSMTANPTTDTSLTETIRRALYGGSAGGPLAFALSGLDIALWDLHGKILGKPIHAMLGGSQRTTMPAYASMIRYANPEVVASECREAVARNYAGIKLHEIGLAEIEAAAGVCAPSARPLMVDVNCAWTLHEATVVARQLEKLGVYWLEEPVWPPENHAAMAVLRSRTRVAVAAGENAPSIADFERMIERQAVGFAQPSVTKIGGLGPFVRIAAKARACGVGLAPHSPYYGPGLLATIHACAALAPDVMIEHLFYDLGPGPFGEAVKPQNGHFNILQGPGLGVEPDLAVLDACRLS